MITYDCICQLYSYFIINIRFSLSHSLQSMQTILISFSNSKTNLIMVWCFSSFNNSNNASRIDDTKYFDKSCSILCGTDFLIKCYCNMSQEQLHQSSISLCSTDNKLLYYFIHSTTEKYKILTFLCVLWYLKK